MREDRRKRMPHAWDDDAICIYCGMDGADDWHQREIVRREVGDDEYKARVQLGYFDHSFECPKRDFRRAPRPEGEQEPMGCS